MRSQEQFSSPAIKVPITVRSQGHHGFSILGAIQNIADHDVEQSGIAGLVWRRGKKNQPPAVLPTCITL